MGGRRAAAWAFSRWVGKRGGTGSHEERQAIEQVRRIIELHGEARFEPVGGSVRDVPNRLGWRKGEGAEREWWVPTETWKSEICDGLDPTFVARTLVKHGMLKRSDGKHLQYLVTLPNKQRARVYVLTAAILDGGEVDGRKNWVAAILGTINRKIGGSGGYRLEIKGETGGSFFDFRAGSEPPQKVFKNNDVPPVPPVYRIIEVYNGLQQQEAIAASLQIGLHPQSRGFGGERSCATCGATCRARTRKNEGGERPFDSPTRSCREITFYHPGRIAAQRSCTGHLAKDVKRAMARQLPSR
jgi:hypothetical protein